MESSNDFQSLHLSRLFRVHGAEARLRILGSTGGTTAYGTLINHPRLTQEKTGEDVGLFATFASTHVVRLTSFGKCWATYKSSLERARFMHHKDTILEG